MTAADLMAFLRDVPPDAVVVVNGEIVISAVCVKGRKHDKDVFGNPTFHRAEKGRDHAVQFLHHTELSTGEWVVSAI